MKFVALKNKTSFKRNKNIKMFHQHQIIFQKLFKIGSSKSSDIFIMRLKLILSVHLFIAISISDKNSYGVRTANFS